MDPIDKSCYAVWNDYSGQTSEPYRVGCKHKLIDWVEKRTKNFIISFSILLALQVLSVILTLMLLRHLGHQRLANSIDQTCYNEQILLT